MQKAVFGDPFGLDVDRVQALAANYLVLEIAAGGARLGEAGDVARAFGGVVRIGALEVDRDR